MCKGDQVQTLGRVSILRPPPPRLWMLSSGGCQTTVCFHLIVFLLTSAHKLLSSCFDGFLPVVRHVFGPQQYRQRRIYLHIKMLTL